MKPISLIKQTTIFSLAPLFVACTSLDTYDATVTHDRPTTYTNGDVLLPEQIKAYEYTLGVRPETLKDEIPQNQQEIYNDLILSYDVKDYTVNQESSSAVLVNKGVAGEAYNLEAFGDNIPGKRHYSPIGEAIVFDGEDDILSSLNPINGTYFKNGDGYTVIMSGRLIYKNTPDDVTPENILQIGTDSGTDNNRSPIVISQSAANNKMRIIGRSSGVGSIDNEEHYITPNYSAFTLVHTGAPEAGSSETILITELGATHLDRTIWYSFLENKSPDFLRHLEGNSSNITPLSATNGIISIGGNPSDSNSRASIALKSIDVYNEQIDFNRIVLAASVRAKEVGIDARLLLASRLTEEYVNADFYAVMQETHPEYPSSTLGSLATNANANRETNIEKYEENKVFLSDPLADCTEEENTISAETCLKATLTTFGSIMAFTTDLNNLSSSGAWDSSLLTLTKSFPSLMLNAQTLPLVGEGNTTDINTWSNTVTNSDPKQDDRLSIAAEQTNIVAQPAALYNAGGIGNEEFKPYNINNRQAYYFDGASDYMIVSNLNEVDLPPAQLATEGFIVSLVFQLSPIDYNDSQSKSILRVGPEALDKRNYPILDITTRGNNPCAIQIVHAGTQTSEFLDTNCYPTVLTYYSPPVEVTRVRSSGYTTYTSSGIKAYVNGREVETNVASAWHKVNGANGITTPDVDVSIGANAHSNRAPSNSNAAVNISHIGFWTKSDFEDANELNMFGNIGVEMNEKTARKISRTLKDLYGITASGLPVPGPRVIEAIEAAAEAEQQPVAP